MRLAYFIFFLLFISCNNDQDWKYLFNGENLDGWEIKIREHKIGENLITLLKLIMVLLKYHMKNTMNLIKNLDIFLCQRKV